MREISAKTQKVGIIGWPLGHSASPRLHNTAFAAAGLDFIYLYLPVAPKDIAGAVDALKILGFAGANVTIPHKVAVIPFLDFLDESAKLVGAVNTIVIKDAKSIGYNTDISGFSQSMYAENVNMFGKKAVIFGCGGACRAVVGALIENGAADISILARDGNKALATADLFSSLSLITPRGYAWDDAICCEILAQADILINSTPLGMSPEDNAMIPLKWELLKPEAVLIDLIYNPPVTLFMKNALARGHKTVNGEGMLIEQAAAAFTLWTEKEAPRDVMYKIIRQKFKPALHNANIQNYLNLCYYSDNLQKKIFEPQKAKFRTLIEL